MSLPPTQSTHQLLSPFPSQEHPPSSTTMARCFKAIVGALSVSAPAVHCQAFVRDFVVAQLVGKDIDDIWKVGAALHFDLIGLLFIIIIFGK